MKNKFLQKYSFYASLNDKNLVRLDLKIDIIKALLIVSFLAIMIPSGKLILPNGGILLVMDLQLIEYSTKERPKLNINFGSVLAIITSISLVFIIVGRTYYNFIAIALQLIWLGYLSYTSKLEDLDSAYFLTTIGVYLFLCALLLMLLFRKQKVKNYKS
jgi:hypothetical protein